MSGDVLHIDGSTSTPTPTPGTLVLTEKARDAIGLWLHDESTNTDDLSRCLMVLIRMGARGYFESENLVTFETPTLTVGMFRDRKGEVSLHS